ncbi:MAG: hypothetical protein ACOCV2_07500, partial [Persicimonas sp.]
MTNDICYHGPPRMTEEGRDVVAFHLHRYLVDWLEQEHRARVRVTVGFEGSVAEGETFEVSVARCTPVEVAWNFQDLCHVYRHGDGRLQVERSDGDIAGAYELVPLVEEPASGGESRALLGFALVDEEEVFAPDALNALADKAIEAIRAARRNAMRLLFDEHAGDPVKPFLYRLMAHLPEWTGCDHSVSMLMTANLEAMNLEASGRERVSIIAERLFVADDASLTRRLVGMSFRLDEASGELVRAAVEEQIARDEPVIQIFERSDEGDWRRQRVEDGTTYGPIHCCEERDDEKLCILVPLLACADGERELLGFAALFGRDGRELPASTAALLVELSQNCSSVLRYSPLFTLSARKLWVLRQTRQALTGVLTRCDVSEESVDALVGEVTSLIAEHVDVPSFAIGHLRRRDGDRYLHYTEPHGWTRYEQLELPVDVAPDRRADSGVSALAVRINRRLVLSGGRGAGEAFAFKNYLYVDEQAGEVVDARAPNVGDAEALEDDARWARLSDYYKPARASAYATLAYPITFGDEPLGVLTIEVERDTDWLWWTGFGARLFWESLAGELA